MIEVYILNISPLYDMDVFQQFYNRSSVNRQKRADTYQKAADKARCIGAGILLAYSYELFQKELARANSFDAYKVDNIYRNKRKVSSLCDEPNVNVHEINSMEQIQFQINDIENKLQVTKQGKPFFMGQGITEPYFNLSHSGDYVSIVMATDQIGIDIQNVVKMRDKVVEKFFTKPEKQRIKTATFSQNQSNEDQIFTEIWTQKEAVAKLDGRGIAAILESRNTELGIKDTELENRDTELENRDTELENRDTVMEHRVSGFNMEEVHIKSIWINHDYVLSVAWKK